MMVPRRRRRRRRPPSKQLTTLLLFSFTDRNSHSPPTACYPLATDLYYTKPWNIGICYNDLTHLKIIHAINTTLINTYEVKNNSYTVYKKFLCYDDYHCTSTAQIFPYAMI